MNIYNSENGQICVNLLMTSQWLPHGCLSVKKSFVNSSDDFPLLNVNISNW